MCGAIFFFQPFSSPLYFPTHSRIQHLATPEQRSPAPTRPAPHRHALGLGQPRHRRATQVRRRVRLRAGQPALHRGDREGHGQAEGGGQEARGEGPLADQLAQSGAPGSGAHHDEAEESGVDGLGQGDADPGKKKLLFKRNLMRTYLVAFGCE